MVDGRTAEELDDVDTVVIPAARRQWRVRDTGVAVV